MLSQLTKTIKMALKSTEEERAILRARSAVQRFPVIEWRQRIEDFHRNSIISSRRQAERNAWRELDCDGGNFAAMADSEDWSPVDQTQPSQPPVEWDQETQTNNGDKLIPPPLAVGARPSEDGSVSSQGSSVEGYEDFLERANRTFAKRHRNVPDPFLETNPARPFGNHSRISSTESISSIVDEKYNSVLNKANATVGYLITLSPRVDSDPQFTDADGGVASDFVQKLQYLNAENSKGELSIDYFLVRSEEAFFGRVRKDKLSSAASVRSSQRDSVWAPSVYSRHICTSASPNNFWWLN
jgi:alpha-1,3-glucan synthase